jgi:hypothetical protein
MAALVAWLRQVSEAHKRAMSGRRFHRASTLTWGDDNSTNKWLEDLFVGWDKIPPHERAKEIKGVLRYAAAYPIQPRFIAISNRYDTAYQICSAISLASQMACQTAVNTAVNTALRRATRHESRAPGDLGELLAHLLAQRPNRKLAALTAAADKARKSHEWTDGFSDFKRAHTVRIVWHGQTIATTWLEQWGACALAHGRTCWDRRPGWDEMMATNEWPQFVTEDETSVTWMEII